MIIDFWMYLRDAVIYNCQKTEDGRKYLEKVLVAGSGGAGQDSIKKIFWKRRLIVRPPFLIKRRVRIWEAAILKV